MSDVPLVRSAKDRCGLDLRALLDHLGVDAFISAFLAPRITAKLRISGKRPAAKAKRIGR